MNAKVKEVAMNKKGKFTNVVYSKKCKTYKGSPEITKTTRMYNVRCGVEYDALQTTLDSKGVENKVEAHDLNMGLKGMHYVNYPTIIASDKTGKEYIRFATNKNTKFRTEYMCNGEVVDKREIEGYLLASERQSRKELPSVLNIGIEDITYIK